MADDSGRLNQVFAETSFLYGANAVFIEMMQEKWAQDPNSVPPEWRAFFDSLMDKPDTVKANAEAGSWGSDVPAPRDENISAMDGFWPAVQAKVEKGIAQKAEASGKPASQAELQAASRDSIRALMLIRAFRIRGHLQANLDPLGIEQPGQNPELTPEYWGFGAADMDRPIFIDGVLGLESASLREIIQIVRRTYCGNIGVQYMHIADPAEKAWVQERIEGRDKEISFTKEGK
ncbi:2-oxoglutarate dehydrogenase E1 subunit family protein, partial [Asticcacaulis sp. AC460]|uniref:2-oxoglutarate dehydrogenase E1 subunit family protein n=1 Tax=Asticcacaulis sp. AC460 TaxID=1282360 RepID=UPI0004CEA240